MNDYRAITTMISRVFAVLSLLLPISGSAGNSLPEPVQVSPHAWAWIGPYGPPAKENQGFRMNLGFVAGKDGVAVIDSGYGNDMANEMLEQIRRITGRPVTYVVNTNSQPHRVLGNAAFRKAGAKIIAAKDAAPRIIAEGAAMARTAEGILELAPGSITPPGAPDLALDRAKRLDLGGVTLNLIPVGTAHTAGSLIVEVVEDGAIYTGDVLYGGRMLAVLPVSRVDGWIAAFDRLRAFDEVLLVPGHGEVGILGDFEHSTSQYLSALKAHMDEAVEQGVDMQDAIDSLDQNSWRKLVNFEELSGRNAHQTYLEREEAAFE